MLSQGTVYKRKRVGFKFFVPHETQTVLIKKPVLLLNKSIYKMQGSLAKSIVKMHVLYLYLNLKHIQYNFTPLDYHDAQKSICVWH